MADGSLIFDTKIDSSGAGRDLAKLKVKLEKATNAVGKQANLVSKLESELKKVGKAQVPTEAYSCLEQSFQKADTRLQGLIDRQDKFLATGGATSGAAWEKLQYDIEKTAAEVREYQAQMEAMKAGGSAFTKDSAAVADLSAKLDTAKIKLDELKLKEQEAGAALIHATSPKNLNAMSSAIKNASSSLAMFKSRLSAVLRSALIFTAITRMAAKFRDYVSEAAISNNEFRESLGRLKGALQSAFTPIFTAVLPALTSLINALATAITYITQFVGLIFGRGSGSGSARLQSANVSLASSSNSAAKAFESETASLMTLSETAKDAEKSMASFDEINQIGSASKAGGGSGAGAGVDIPSISPEALEMPTWMIDVAERLADAFSRIGDALKRIGDSNSFRSLLTWLKELIGLAAETVIYTLANAVESLASALEMLDAALSGDFWGALDKLFETDLNILRTILTPFQKIKKWLGEKIDASGLSDGLKDFFKHWVSFKMDNIIDGLTGGWWKKGGAAAAAFILWIKNVDLKEWWETKIAPWFSKEKWQKQWENVRATWSSKWGEISAWWKSSGLYKWWSEDVAPWFSRSPWEVLWGVVKSAFTSGWQGISTWWRSSALVKWWSEDVSPWFTTKRWQGEWNNVKAAFQSKWSEIKAWWKTNAIAQWWREDVAPWFTKEKWYGVMSGIKDGFKSAFDDAVAVAKKILNDFITKVNSFFNISFPGLEVGGKQLVPAFSTQLIRIPYLAQGAVIPPNREFLAVLGDQKSGTNIEAPLDTIVAAFRQVMREGSGGKGEAVMEVDGQVFGRLVYKYGNKESKRVGVRLAGV